ncbi:Major facilitator superfamily domain-containing protein 7 [Seminavis robusta]|uniref:Major facilitator superfamily domain-containing protein 7 n=1 Tax=Seminavis robusta TaxID=568900 RepID=A0A9N8H2A7_9STRA|nr:Major facilitator superfamily domain-containing protein 7 [Seminavis robusta]|eukprot:Sro15_g011400.1 Major facilitator superfamily domain-containing protein 7 (558) ;mRNA; f:166812-168485
MPKIPLNAKAAFLGLLVFSASVESFVHNSRTTTLTPKIRRQPWDTPTIHRTPTKIWDNLNGENGLNGSNGEIDLTKVSPRVYPQRWVQLAYLSLLALLSDWVCFSLAATPSVFEDSFHHSAASLIDLFLFTNVASCFLVTDVVAKVGLQKAIQGAAVLMAAGCWLRSGLGFVLPVLAAHAADLPDAMADTVETLASSVTPDGLVPYPVLVAGTLMVGAAQPFFQCTPPLLSALWFASDERATSTAVALNFNQIGIATAFLVGGAMATSASGMENYFGLIAVLASVAAAGSLLQFEDEPPIPPSASELEKKIKGEIEPPFIESAKKFFATKGFTRALAAFVCSISITNIVGAFIDEVMVRGGVTEQFQIDLAGAGFELAILVGGIAIGGYVDRSKKYKSVTMACLAATAFLSIPLGLTDHWLGNEPILLVMSLLGLGLAAGPVQPINAELAVDVTYPGDETAVESVQQIGGNLISALLVPLAELATRQDYEMFRRNKFFESDIRGDVILLVLIASATLAYYSGFDAPLLRSAADAEGEEQTPEVSASQVAAVNDAVLK